MPELPEVETIRRSLAPHLPGARIRRVRVRQRHLRRTLPADFAHRLTGRAFGAILRRGKYLLFALDNGAWLLVHCGMSGTLRLRPSGRRAEKHDHVLLLLDGRRTLVFNDPRRFGLMRVGSLSAFDEVANVGGDPLSESWTAARLRRLIGKRRLPIKNFLMDQRMIGGIGNIYANEILFRAAVRPRRRASRLRTAELEAVAAAMPQVLKEAVELGGSSISDFRDAAGRTGYFQLRVAVYGRAGRPCRACGTLVKKVLLSGRSSFYCPRCQR